MRKKIKLLHVITHLPIGGAQDNTLYTVELLDKDKYDISLCCNLSGELVSRAKKIKYVNLYDVPNLLREVSIINDIIAFISLYRLSLLYGVAITKKSNLKLVNLGFPHIFS